MTVPAAPVAGEPAAADSLSLAWRYGAFVLGFAAFLALMALCERLGLPRGWIGACFLVVTVAAYAGIGFMSRTSDEVEYFVAGRRVPAIFNGLATAADWMSAASFIGTAGVLYLHGFGGLVYILGWTGGFCLLAILLVPYLRRLGQYTIPDFLHARYGGNAPRLIGAGAVMGVSFVYVVVQIYGVGLITSHMTGFGFELGILIGLGGVLLCSFLGGMRAVTWTQVAQYFVLIIAYLVPLIWLSVQQSGSWWPVLTYGRQLVEVTQREQQLIRDPRELEVAALLKRRAAASEMKLQDVPAAMASDEAAQLRSIGALRAASAPLARVQRAEREYVRRPRTAADAAERYRQERDMAIAHALPLAGLSPQAQAFSTTKVPGHSADMDDAAADLSRVNFIALMLCLMMGTAAMPHLLTRFYTPPTASAARRSVGWSLLFITLLYLAAPALAVLVKYEVFMHLVGSSIDELPAWISRWSRFDPQLVSVHDLNGDGLLQLGELTLGGDAIVLAAPEIGGLPYWVTCLVAVGGLAAALSTADGLLLTIANALSHDIFARTFHPRLSPPMLVTLSKILVMLVALAAAGIAALRITDILQFVSCAFSLSASAFFPALVGGIFWARASRAGAVAAMLTGLAVCGGYMTINMPLLRHWVGLAGTGVDHSWFGIDAVAAGVFGVPAGLLALVVFSLLTPPPGESEMRLLARLRTALPEPRA